MASNEICIFTTRFRYASLSIHPYVELRTVYAKRMLIDSFCIFARSYQKHCDISLMYMISDPNTSR